MRYFGFDKPSFAFKTFGFGSSDDAIKALFAGGKQGIWLDPSDLSTMFKDAAGTQPVTTDGDPVGLIRDKSGNGYHATQSVSAARPTYRTDGVLRWLEFDGADDYLTTMYTPASDWSSGVGLVVKRNAGFIFESNPSAANNYLAASTSNVSVFSAPDGYGSALVFTLNNPFVYTTSVVGDNIGSYPMSIGARYTDTISSYRVNVDIYGLVVLDIVTTSDLNNINKHLAKKSGVTL